MAQSTATNEYHGGRTSWRARAKSTGQSCAVAKKYTQIFEKMESKPKVQSSRKGLANGRFGRNRLWLAFESIGGSPSPTQAQRLGLAFMRRPGCKPHKVEGRAQAPVRIGEALGVDGASAKENLATKRFAAARMQRVRCPHGAQVGEKREHVRVADDCAIEIDDRERQARALRQAAKSAHVDEGGDAGRRAAEDLALGDRQA